MANRRRFAGVRKSSSGQAPVLAAVLFLLLVPTTIIIAENATGNITGSMLANISLGNATIENATNESATPGAGAPAIIINDTVPSNKTAPLNQTNITATENATLPVPEPGPEPGNQTSPINDTASLLNETLNITAQLNITLPDNATAANGTAAEEPLINASNETEYVPDVSNMTVLRKAKPVLEVTLDIPERVDRNEPFLVSADVSNTGKRAARNVEVEWVLPKGFSVIEGDAIYHCDIPAGASCVSSLTVTASLSSELGEREIKALVRYHG